MTFTSNIPAANNNPSADQPLMLGNFSAINTWVNVDHIGFNTTPSGQHKQVTFNSTNPPAVAPTDPTSILYTNTIGMAATYNTASASTNAEMFFRNASTIFPVSMIKAFGNFDTNCTQLNAWNIKGTVVGGPTNYTYLMEMPSGACNSSNYTIIVGSSSTNGGVGLIPITTIINSTQFNIQFFNLAGNTPASNFSVVVLQL